MPIAAILALIIKTVPQAMQAFQTIRATLGTHEQAALDSQLAAVRAERHAADDELDRVLRERGLG